jgi:carboxymethylenebutenolidase
MCYDDKARPPQPPGATGAADGADLVLTAADGTQFSAYAARPASARPAQVLIYPDIRGLHQFYKDLAQRFAEVGITALAIDYFGRTAGLTSRAEPFEFRPHVEQMTVPHVQADTQAALDYLRQGPGAGRPTFILGFCRGGSLSLYSAAQPYSLAGIVAFYAGLGRRLDEAQGTPVDVAPRVRCPVLGLFGGADAGIPPEHVAALDQALDQAGVPHEIVTYPGAPHSFFDRRAEDFAEASADAWQRVLRFMLPA